MSHIEQLTPGDEKDLGVAENHTRTSDDVFAHPIVANDDHKSPLAEQERPVVRRSLYLSAYPHFFGGVFITLIASYVTFQIVENGHDLQMGDFALIGALLTGIIWLVSLIVQNNTLTAAYHKSEISRLRPETIANAAHHLAQHIETMEKKIENYHGDVSKTVAVIRQESGLLNSQFISGASEIRDVLERFEHARDNMAKTFNSIRTMIETAESSIKTSVTKFPIETQHTTDEMVRIFNTQMDHLITKMRMELSAEEKFKALEATFKKIETGVADLFRNFETQLTGKIEDLKPALDTTAATTADSIQTRLTQSSHEVKDHLDRIVSDIQTRHHEFFEKFPSIVTELKVNSGQVSQEFSESVSEASRNVIGALKDEREKFETEYKAGMQSLSEFIKQVSKEIKDTTDLLEKDFDGFLGKFNFNFIGKLNFFSELVESKTHHFSDRMLEEIDLLKRNFAELANSFSQIIESSMVSFDRRSEYMTVEIENHLSGIISKSLANIATRLDLFEEQVSSRINKMNTAIGGDPHLTRRPMQQSRFNNDYLSILEQQMNDIHQSLYELKQSSTNLTRK